MKNLKRIAGLTLAASLLGASAMAAPVNQMAAHETAIGANTKGAYVEHKVTGKATVGYEYMDRDEYNNQDAAYLQYDIIGSEVKAIGGYRWNLPGDKSNAFIGAAVSTPKVFGFDAYDNYFYGDKSEEDEFNYAWLQHIHNNPHHWQYWVLINDDDGTIGLDIPYNYIIEMILDWWSFSWKTGNLYEIFNWYNEHKKTMILNETTKIIVESILNDMREILDNQKK